MESNAGATDIWKKSNPRMLIIPENITSGSAVIPQIMGNRYLNNFLEYEIDPDKNDKDYVKKVNDIKIKILEMQVLQQEENYKLQKTYGKIIFVLASVSFIGGLVVSGFQFYNAIRLNDFNSTQTELSLSVAGDLVLKSSLIGSFVLVISLVFFYMFLRYGYVSQYSTMNPDKLIKLMKD